MSLSRSISSDGKPEEPRLSLSLRTSCSNLFSQVSVDRRVLGIVNVDVGVDVEILVLMGEVFCRNEFREAGILFSPLEEALKWTVARH